MIYYVCVDEGNPFKVDLSINCPQCGDKFYYVQGDRMRLFEIVDVHTNSLGKQLQVTEYDIAKPYYPIAV